MIEPIRLAFEVACPADHAFEVWTGRISAWRDRNHGGWATLLSHFVAAAQVGRGPVVRPSA